MPSGSWKRQAKHIWETINEEASASSWEHAPPVRIGRFKVFPAWSKSRKLIRTPLQQLLLTAVGRAVTAQLREEIHAD